MTDLGLYIHTRSPSRSCWCMHACMHDDAAMSTSTVPDSSRQVSYCGLELTLNSKASILHPVQHSRTCCCCCRPAAQRRRPPGRGPAPLRGRPTPPGRVAPLRPCWARRAACWGTASWAGPGRGCCTMPPVSHGGDAASDRSMRCARRRRHAGHCCSRCTDAADTGVSPRPTHACARSCGCAAVCCLTPTSSTRVRTHSVNATARTFEKQIYVCLHVCSLDAAGRW